MNAHTPAIATPDEILAGVAQAERSNILIVDDRLDKRVVFRTILEELDQNIVTASSGEEALRWLLDNDCAVILLDVNMPGMDGLETAELIRSRRKSAHTPIIFITAFADEMHTARGYSLGAVDYILSPVVPNILRSKVKALVQLHRLNAELRKRSDERVALAREQAARSAAEEQQRRASFLAEATQAIASSLDADTILKAASTLAVPFLADYCAVAAVGEDGAPRVRRTASVPGWDGYLGAHRESFEAVLAEQQSRVVARGAHALTERLALPLDADAPDDTPAGEIHAFPLVTRGKTRGALLLAMGPSSRRLSGADLSLADNLAGRVAAALDNCLLYEEIQAADRRKNEFLATLSHELRNPLAPMRAALHMLRSQAEVDPGRARSLLETMDRQVAQMSRLVEDLLDISRITRGVIELRREPVDVCAEIRHAMESCEGPVRTLGHQLVLDLPADSLKVVADRVRLQQILENLVLNAVKYTEPGGRIEVSARAEPSEIVISVKDNGIGIPPDKLKQVWDLFVQVDESPERTRKGLGIGLALVQDLVRRHGGAVQAHSEGLGKGSTFQVRLPRTVAEEAPLAAEAGSPSAHATTGKRVLVVDDNIDAAETLAMMLELLGQKTSQAHDGNAALRAAAEFRPEVVFMDIGLPGLSGHEAAVRMRRDLGMTDVYLVALSGYGTEDDRRKSLDCGFDSHLVKPLDPSLLPEILAGAERRPAAGVV
ncbi:MAG TPA: response regulator [Usitatibacter sp.]|nr:response regulator [Usitatibacter sp.]